MKKFPILLVEILFVVKGFSLSGFILIFFLLKVENLLFQLVEVEFIIELSWFFF